VSWNPCLIRVDRGDDLAVLTIGHPAVDDYLAFVGARARPNTWLAVAFDLKVFFSLVPKDPADVTTADVFAFIKAQRQPRLGDRVVRLEDGEAGLSARPSPGACRASAACSTTWSLGQTAAWLVTRCRVGWRHAGPVTGGGPVCRWSAGRGHCHEFLPRARSTRS